MDEEVSFEFDITDFIKPEAFKELFDLSMKYEARIEIRDDRMFFMVRE